MKRIVIAAPFGLLLLLTGCTGDERPFLEAVEVQRLGVDSLEIRRPEVEGGPEAFSIGVGERLALGLAALDANGNEIALDGDDRDWRSADPSVLTVSRDGVITGRTDGTTELDVSVGNVVAGALSVRVSDGALVSIDSIAGPAMPDACGATRYVAIGAFEDSPSRLLSDVDWTVGAGASLRAPEDSDLATGAIRLVPAGAGAVTLGAQVGDVIATPRTLTAPDTLTGLTLPTGLQALRVDGTLQLVATARYEDDGSARSVDVTDGVDWSVTSGDAVSVSNDAPTRGLVRGRRTGNGIVQAACGTDTATVTIGVDASGSDDDDEGLSIEQDGPLFLRFGGLDVQLRVSTGSEFDDDRVVTDGIRFSSEDTRIASVVTSGVNAGLITAGNVAGTTFINARRGDETDSIEVTVN